MHGNYYRWETWHTGIAELFLFHPVSWSSLCFLLKVVQQADSSRFLLIAGRHDKQTSYEQPSECMHISALKAK